MTTQKQNQKQKFSLPRALAAELFGTLLLTFIDAAISIVDHQKGGTIGVLARSLGAVAVVSSLIFLIGEVSGAHVNPVVTLAFASQKVFPWKRVPLYIVAQVTGAIIGGCLIYALFGSDISFGITEPKQSYAFAFEILFTWFLVTAIVTSAEASSIKGWESAFPVGATLLFCGLVGKEISGASMNPARSLGTALFGGGLNTIWIYTAGPVIGSLIGVLTALVLRGGPSQKELESAQGK